MHIEGLMQYIDNRTGNKIRKLIALKATVGEKYSHQKDESMQLFIMNLFAFVQASKNDLGVNSQDYTLLNKFFLKTLNKRTSH